VRQRRVKNKDEIMRNAHKWVVNEPQSLKGNWKQAFKNEHDIYLEIGSGKGQFIAELALQESSNNFIAAEGGENIVVRILEKAQAVGLGNLLVIPEYITDPCAIFATGELSGIYINFCDPWPKDRHSKRRLIHREMLEKYRKITNNKATLAFKTDNHSLFEFSMDEFKSVGLNVFKMSTDLHNSEYAYCNTPTEYEDKFAAEGKPIFYALVSLENN